MDITDFPIITGHKLQDELVSGMEFRGKGMLFAIWWPDYQTWSACERREVSRTRVRAMVNNLVLDLRDA